MSVTVTATWGVTTVGGTMFKDAIIIGNVAAEWDWRTDGFKHSPGYTTEFLNKYIELYRPNIIICSSGFEGRVMQSYLMEGSPVIYYMTTPAAVAMFNTETAAGKKVLFFCHSTC